VRTVILVAGPSGSGKSRLSGRTGVPQLRLDDFYRDLDEPGLPMATMPGGLRMIDWDDMGSWNLDAAVEALAQVARTGRAIIPTYDISISRATGTQQIDIGGAPALICEGIFAVELAEPCRARGLQVEAIWLDRPRWFNFARRLQRDLRQRRKAPSVLIRRGLGLVKLEPGSRKVALARGFTPMGMKHALGHIQGLVHEGQAAM